MEAGTTDRPSETEAERADRNFGDILQELRVAQTGVQILFAFLLTMPLQARFPTLTQFQEDVYVFALYCAALATACIIGPVAYHRVLFRRRMKDHLVKVASRLAAAGLVFLGLAIVSSVYLVLDLVTMMSTALVLAAVLTVVLLGLWVILPVLALRQRRQEDADES